MIYIENLDKIKKNLRLNEGGEVDTFFLETCYRYMDKYVPMDKGLLRTIVDIDNQYITYMSPYASYQYYGQREDGSHKVNPDNYTTPGTGTYWDKKMISIDGEDVVKEVRDFIKRG